MCSLFKTTWLSTIAVGWLGFLTSLFELIVMHVLLSCFNAVWLSNLGEVSDPEEKLLIRSKGSTFGGLGLGWFQQNGPWTQKPWELRVYELYMWAENELHTAESVSVHLIQIHGLLMCVCARQVSAIHLTWCSTSSRGWSCHYCRYPLHLKVTFTHLYFSQFSVCVNSAVPKPKTGVTRTFSSSEYPGLWRPKTLIFLISRCTFYNTNRVYLNVICCIFCSFWFISSCR